VTAGIPASGVPAVLFAAVDSLGLLGPPASLSSIMAMNRVKRQLRIQPNASQPQPC
jgi:hypothetical protein